jgi:hypothetical protein
MAVYVAQNKSAAEAEYEAFQAERACYQVAQLIGTCWSQRLLRHH